MFDFIFSHLLESLFSTFLWWVIGFIIGLIGLFILKRKGYLKRKNRLLKFIVATYFFGIPSVFGFSFGCYGLLRNVEQDALAVSAVTVHTIKEITYPAFDNYITQSLDSLKDSMTKSEFINDFLNNGQHDFSYIQNEISSSVLNYAVDFATDKFISNTSEYVGTDDDKFRGALLTIASGNIDRYHSDLFLSIDRIVTKSINRILFLYHLLNILFFVSFMVFPVIEITLSGVKIKRESRN